MRLKCVEASYQTQTNTTEKFAMQIKSWNGGAPKNTGVFIQPYGNNGMYIDFMGGGGPLIDPIDNGTGYRMIRLTISGDQVIVWDLEQPGTTTMWKNLGQFYLASSGNDIATFGVPASGGGFLLGSGSGGSTAWGTMRYDWVGVSYGQTLSGNDPIGNLYGELPEPASLSLLVLGAIPLLRRRR
jgi:hypothetical protein